MRGDARMVERVRRVLIYDFWAHDAATDIVRETLEGLGIPYEVKTRRTVRDPSAPRDCRFDEWAEVYVDVNRLVRWLKEKIEGEVGGS